MAGKRLDMKRTTGLFFLLLLPLCSGASPAPSKTTLEGRIAYLRGGWARVAPAGGGPELRVPGSKGAVDVSLSPRGDTLIFFVATGKSASGETDPPTRGMVSRAPFRSVEPLPAPWNHVKWRDLFWSPDGNLAYLRAENKSTELQAIYHSATGKLQASRVPVETTSRDGRVTAWCDGWDVMVQSSERKSPTSVYTVTDRGALREALRHARYPAGIKPLLDRPKEDGQEHPWYVSSAALMPDGQRLFFTCNAGSPAGSSGNGTYGFFAVDLRTRKLAVLSRLGSFEGCRPPDVCQVSPDGKRMAISYSAYGGIVSQAYFLRIVDLETQRSRELLRRAPWHEDYNLAAGGPSWSPDGRYVAQDSLYYKYGEDGKTRSWKPGQGWRNGVSEWEPLDEDYAVKIFDAATGKVVREMPGTRTVTWGR